MSDKGSLATSLTASAQNISFTIVQVGNTNFSAAVDGCFDLATSSVTS